MALPSDEKFVRNLQIIVVKNHLKNQRKRSMPEASHCLPQPCKVEEIIDNNAPICDAVPTRAPP
eukprot:scaffold21_cov342-Pavlova_lutheri.AAC.1